MSSSDAAAWSQALAAVIAIATTAYLSRRDAADRRTEAMARARSAAIAIFPAMVDELASLSWAVHQLDEGMPVGAIGRNGPGDDDVIALWDTSTLTPALESARPLLHELRDFAEPVQRAYLSLSLLQTAYNDFVMSVDDGGPAATWDWSDEREASIVSKTRSALDRCKQAVEILGEALAPAGRL